ncbi:hypothetical protein VPH35_044149 [Triticum aestivum]
MPPRYHGAVDPSTFLPAYEEAVLEAGGNDKGKTLEGIFSHLEGEKRKNTQEHKTQNTQTNPNITSTRVAHMRSTRLHEQFKENSTRWLEVRDEVDEEEAQTAITSVHPVGPCPRVGERGRPAGAGWAGRRLTAAASHTDEQRRLAWVTWSWSTLDVHETHAVVVNARGRERSPSPRRTGGGRGRGCGETGRNLATARQAKAAAPGRIWAEARSLVSGSGGRRKRVRSGAHAEEGEVVGDAGCTAGTGRGRDDARRGTAAAQRVQAEGAELNGGGPTGPFSDLQKSERRHVPLRQRRRWHSGLRRTRGSGRGGADPSVGSSFPAAEKEIQPVSSNGGGEVPVIHGRENHERRRRNEMGKKGRRGKGMGRRSTGLADEGRQGQCRARGRARAWSGTMEERGLRELQGAPPGRWISIQGSRWMDLEVRWWLDGNRIL